MIRKLINKIIGKKDPIEINLHITGTIKIENDNISINKTNSTSISKSTQVPKKDLEIEPQLNDIAIPAIEFGEEIDGK